jgi:hypothetical protein
MKSRPGIRALVLSRSGGDVLRSGFIVGQGSMGAMRREDTINRGLGLGMLLRVAQPSGQLHLFARSHGALRRGGVGVGLRPAGRSASVVAAILRAIRSRPSLPPVPVAAMRRGRACGLRGLVPAPRGAWRRRHLCARHVVCGRLCSLGMRQCYRDGRRRALFVRGIEVGWSVWDDEDVWLRV